MVQHQQGLNTPQTPHTANIPNQVITRILEPKPLAKTHQPKTLITSRPNGHYNPQPNRHYTHIHIWTREYPITEQQSQNRGIRPNREQAPNTHTGSTATKITRFISNQYTYIISQQIIIQRKTQQITRNCLEDFLRKLPKKSPEIPSKSSLEVVGFLP